MSHCDLLVLKRTSVEAPPENFFADADEIVEHYDHLMDYITEYDRKDYEKVFSGMIRYLKALCGEENIMVTGPLTFKLKRTGIIRYFTDLRSTLFNIVQHNQERPVEEFIDYGLHGWRMIKELIGKDYSGLWQLEDDSPESVTSFFQDLYLFHKEDELELELIQAFDFHF